jgi:hypothetical protein
VAAVGVECFLVAKGLAGLDTTVAQPQPLRVAALVALILVVAVVAVPLLIATAQQAALVLSS